MTLYRLTRDELSAGKYNIRRVLFASFIILIFVSACSGEAAGPLEAGALAASAGGINSSGRVAGELEKSGQIVKEQPQEKISQMPAGIGGGGPGAADAPSGAPPEAPAAVAPEQREAQPAEPQALVAAPVEAASVAQSEPVVDLSIPAGPQVGYRAPDFALQTLDGGTLGLSDLLGRPSLISYWTTWCVPCQNELGILSRISTEYQAQGFQVVTVNAIEQDSLDQVQGAVDQLGMGFPVLLDHGDQFAQSYQALFFPTTIYVDANGVIRFIALGDSSEAEFRDKIEKLLAGEL